MIVPLQMLPLALALAVGAFVLLPRVRANDHLFWSFAGVSVGLVAWRVLLGVRARRTGRRLTVEAAPPVRQHYIQATVQICLYVFWGYHWQQGGVRPIYEQAPLIVAQFLFLYAFDALVAWTRGRPWRLSSGPTPIVLSTNLFIWFRDDWFIWQFAMVAMGVLGKEFIKWQKEGRRTHIFNPSGFGLACAATVLIATGNTDLTWAKSLATTIDFPHIFLFLFVLGLVVQHFFAVTLMTFAAALAMVACNAAYTQATGVYLFASSNLPAAAFLGLHLLMTDPSTSPRTNVGRLLFGLGYGFGYVVAFELLGRIGAPELFAKLYPVPVLNCCVQWLDRIAQAGAVGRFNERWQTALRPRVMNAVHMAAWASVFTALFATGYLGGTHPGDSIAFWKQAVVAGKHDAERKLVMVAGSRAIGLDSADAYNELGILSLQGSIDDAALSTRHKSAAHWFQQAASRGSREANENIVIHFLFDGLRRSDAELGQALQRLEPDGKPAGVRACYLLGLAYETGGGKPPDAKRALQLYRLCGADLFAHKGIARIGLGAGAVVDLTEVRPTLMAAAAAGDGESCFYLAYMHELGRGVAKDHEQALQWWQRARDLEFQPAVDAAMPLPPFAAPRRKFMAKPAWSTAFPLS